MSKSRKVESCKSNPYISKPISRSLLTPCRQVGLSRKRKSLNNLNQSLPRIETQDNQIIGETTANRTPPVEFEDNHQDEETSIEKITIEVYTDSELEEYRNCSNELVEKNKTQTEDNSDALNADIKTTETRRSGRKSKKASKTVQKSKQSRTDRSKTSTPILFDEDEDFVEEDKSRLEQNTTIEDNTISTKLQERNLNNSGNRKRNKKEKRRSKAEEKQNKSPLSDADFVENEAIKKIQVKRKSDVDCLEPTVKLIRSDSERSPRVYTNKKLEKPPKDLDDNEPLSTYKKRKVLTPDLPALEPISPVKKQKKINRSLSLKKTNSDQQISFDLDDGFVNENSPPPSLSLQIDSVDIVELEREIVRKRAIIEDLQQTEIYRQLHDIVELKQLTEIWKNGCITALNDLLPYLKPHDVDMGTLLERLKVPEHLIQLSSTGDLV